MNALSTRYVLACAVLFCSLLVSAPEGAEVAQSASPPIPAGPAEQEAGTPDARILRSVSVERAGLERMRGDLLLEQDRLKQVRKELEQRLQELDKARSELIQEQERLKVEREKEMSHLVKVYESMDPEQAAPLVETMDMGISVELLFRMKGKKAGKILEFVEEKKAVRISEELARRKVFIEK